MKSATQLEQSSVRLRWSSGYYDGPLDGIAELDGKVCWFTFAEEPEDGNLHEGSRNLWLIELTQEQIKFVLQTHEDFARHLGDHFTLEHDARRSYAVSLQTLFREMTERYDSVTAKHYAAYRPPLHRLILERAINFSESFESGLDFGCGTGCSAFALTEFCDRVCGVDMSQRMLDLAEPHSRITYASGTVESLGSLPGRPYDIATFAGSLFYVKSEALRRALISACSPGGTVIIYDFRVLTDELMEHVDATALPAPSDYDYDVDLSKWDEFGAITSEFDRVGIQASPQEAAHVLLSDSFRYDVLQGVLGSQDVFESLVSKLEQRMGTINLRADIWCKRYRLDRKDGITQQVGSGNT